MMRLLQGRNSRGRVLWVVDCIPFGELLPCTRAAVCVCMHAQAHVCPVGQKGRVQEMAGVAVEKSVKWVGKRRICI